MPTNVGRITVIELVRSQDTTTGRASVVGEAGRYGQFARSFVSEFAVTPDGVLIRSKRRRYDVRVGVGGTMDSLLCRTCSLATELPDTLDSTPNLVIELDYRPRHANDLVFQWLSNWCEARPATHPDIGA
ncbi:hypothetical protein ORI20_21465 [Mycobacterium sp. CVI_P3]|uniref:Uncharacterized protein n=1 Tax=Mycobacterium pinniadriaticum TaxID=2994102 RepID=A0ABT3SIA0_9MYCO|nr:hypothetical protein [Mycobacterium pinniadriaticum]MCX2932846.1 hypothetical protein [Mycobacterium pinniadriaticum]MCX2939270.1 hypothetical protein [Mycobacterium pinniadriaticum]